MVSLSICTSIEINILLLLSIRLTNNHCAQKKTREEKRREKKEKGNGKDRYKYLHKFC